MKSNTATAEKYVNGEVPLPPTFSTGYRKDLDIAREMVRRRRNQAIGERQPATTPEDRPTGPVSRLVPV